MMFLLTMIVALVGLVSANSYSIGCMSALMNLAVNPDIAGCLAPTTLLPILVGAGNSGDSVIPYVNTWVTGMCAQPACSSTVLTSIVTNVTASCSTELGLNGNSGMLTKLQSSYAAFRGAVCLEDGTAKAMCVTEILNGMESTWGTMNLQAQNIQAIAKGIAQLPSSILCTDCMKGGYTYINQKQPGSFSSSATSYATQTCGASFTDGGIPPGLIQLGNGINDPSSAPASTHAASPTSTSTSTPLPSATPPTSKKNGALGGPTSSPFMGMAVSGLVVVFTGMTLL